MQVRLSHIKCLSLFFSITIVKYNLPVPFFSLLKSLSLTGLIMVVKIRLRQHEAKELVEIVGGLSYRYIIYGY
jgi:hypothetical protein